MSVAILWHDCDLRTEWNPALSAAAEEHEKVIPLFIYDPEFENLGAASKWWLHHSLEELAKEYKNLGNELILRQGKAIDVLEKIMKETDAETIYFNARFEPKHWDRQTTITQEFPCCVFNGNHLIDPREIEVEPGKPYRAFTPFYKACLKQLELPSRPPLPSKIPGVKGLKTDDLFHDKKWMHKLENYWKPGRKEGLKVLNHFVKSGLKKYAHKRDFPAVEGTSSLSPYLHFGELCPHEIWEKTKGYKAFHRQLFWREFGTYFLFHFPEAVNKNWDEKFNKFKWRYSKETLKKWTKGKTGYPIVDAAMRQLWETGWMHNRLRMIVASFLTKDLLLHWKEGEKWFWDTLVDADKGNNVLGWQWTAGCGPDAAPYFRIFNPVLQGEKFDPEGKFVKHYIPELEKLPKKWIHHPWDAPKEVLAESDIELGETYPKPIVNHYTAREEALKRFDTIK